MSEVVSLREFQQLTPLFPTQGLNNMKDNVTIITGKN